MEIGFVKTCDFFPISQISTGYKYLFSLKNLDLIKKRYHNNSYTLIATEPSLLHEIRLNCMVVAYLYFLMCTFTIDYSSHLNLNLLDNVQNFEIPKRGQLQSISLDQNSLLEFTPPAGLRSPVGFEKVKDFRFSLWIISNPMCGCTHINNHRFAIWPE